MVGISEGVSFAGVGGSGGGGVLGAGASFGGGAAPVTEREIFTNQTMGNHHFPLLSMFLMS